MQLILTHPLVRHSLHALASIAAVGVTCAVGQAPDSRSTPTLAVKRSADNDWIKPMGASSSEADAAPDAAVPNVFATKFDDPAPHKVESIGVAEFNGVKPSVTMSDQLEQLWGIGKEIAHEGDVSVLKYSLKEFPRVDVTLEKNVVKSVTVHLEKPMSPKTLAEKLEVNDVRSVRVPDDAGSTLGLLFPEHGVLFNFSPDGKRVLQVALEGIDLEAFLLRAETDLQTHSRDSLADIDYVLQQQPGHARALWLRAKLLSQFARYDEALLAVKSALTSEPANPAFRLTLAEILGANGKYDEAAAEIQDVLAGINLPGELKAKGLCLLGDFLAASPAHDYKQAMEHHMSAIQTADPLSVDEHFAVRRAAKLALIEAHLALAHDIAAGTFQQKDRVIPKWLNRAAAYVQDMIESEDGDPALRLQLAQGALAACAAADGKIDPVPWTRTALQNGKDLIAAAEDPWRKSCMEWELGATLAEGLLADDQRGATQHVLANSTMTASYLESGAKNRRSRPEDLFRLGRLYYRIGSIYAVKKNDHKTAITWYEKAIPMLDRPLPAVYCNEQGRYGEWLVSMGISYWETNDGDYALQLTDAGLRHVEEAVTRQLLDPKALAIPYNNLAMMHEALGHQNEAKNFAELATKSQSVTRR